MNNSDDEIVKTFVIFKKWTDSFTMHGFPNIFRTKYITVRMMWIILFLFSNGFCFYIITKNIMNFFKYEVVTTIKVAERDSLPFPAVTVCNANSFVTEGGLQYVSDVLDKYNLTDFPNVILKDAYEGNLNDNSSILYFNYIFFRYFTTVFTKSSPEEIKQKLKIPYEQMFISCLYNFQPCNKNNWTWYYDSFFGNCYRFNTQQNSEIKNSYQAGKYQGLMIELFVGIPENQTTLSISTGAHIFVDDNLFKPFLGQGVDIAPGFISNLVLHRISTQQLPKPYSECNGNLDTINSFDSEYYRKVFRSNLTYRQDDCFLAYIQSEILKKCDCDEMAYNLISESNNPCDTLEEQICSMDHYQDLTQSNYKDKIENLCPLECQSVSFEIAKSENRYPSVNYAKDLIKTHEKLSSLLRNKTNISIEDLRENILAVNVYYEHLKVTEIRQSPSITWDGLVGSVGGTLGLFLGISFLSFVELIDLLFQIVFNKTSNKVFSSTEN
ncbi:acid-sensing ion channel 1 [Brachionus plicatilis]|uniref:Acid-sensing ion channel 1 n=1 Tax=Brachionus plicatilis TaxID=10195 RepID=A0A3M7P0Y1_BRAPC|nr:acid-sensing ion channel 1 [Brachionus plicatilis]